MVRRAIISDIHGNLAALDAVLADIRTNDIAEILCLGDVIGYGPDPLPCLDIARDFKLCILGNHDLSALFDSEGFNSAAEQAVFWTRRQIELGPDGPEASRQRMQFLCDLPRTHREGELLFVHGSPRGPTTEYVFPEDIHNRRKLDRLFAMVPRICFQGHTHVPGIFTQQSQFLRPDDVQGRYNCADGKFMVNVGSVGQPRDGDPRSCYVVLDGNVVQFRRVAYDIESTVVKIEAEPDLDNFLGYRLREGR